jgi:hypothetical protein
MPFFSWLSRLLDEPRPAASDSQPAVGPIQSNPIQPDQPHFVAAFVRTRLTWSAPLTTKPIRVNPGASNEVQSPGRLPGQHVRHGPATAFVRKRPTLTAQLTAKPI